MTPTYGQSAAPQLTAGGTGSPLDVSAGATKSLYLRHSNGTGAVTNYGTATVQVKPTGGTFTDLQGFAFSTVAAKLDQYVVELPPDCVSVRVAYVAPTGPTGYTLDYEVGTQGAS